MIKRYHQIICDNCCCAIDNIEPKVRLTYRQVRSRGIIISKGKHFCSEDCKKNYFLSQKGVKK